MTEGRLAQQLAFLVEADKLKRVLRRTPLTDASRQENSAEHSWHLMLVAMVVREYAAADFDLAHALEMVAVHDLVEIDAGDTFAYDDAAQESKTEREMAAADRIFGLLPPDQASRARALWDEFEAQESPAACFANAVDRFQPLLQDVMAGGGTCHGLHRDQVLRRMAPVQTATPGLWPAVMDVVDSFCASGVIRISR